MTTTILVDKNIKDVLTLRLEVERANCQISSVGEIILRQPTAGLNSMQNRYDLARISPRSIGFSEPPLRTNFYNRAVGRGLMIVPAGIGPWLRIQYQHERNEVKWTKLGMHPIKHPDDGTLHILCLGDLNNRHPWLATCNGDPELTVDLDDQYLFGRVVDLSRN